MEAVQDSAEQEELHLIIDIYTFIYRISITFKWGMWKLASIPKFGGSLIESMVTKIERARVEGINVH